MPGPNKGKDMSLADFKGKLDAMRTVLDNCEAKDLGIHRPSEYWRGFICFFSYVFSWRQEVLRYLRHHTDMLTSDHPNRYFDVPYNSEHKKRIIKEYESLSMEMSDIEPFSEPSAMGGFGFKFGNRMINNDIIRYMTALKMIRQAIQLSSSKQCNFLEVGGGWGGLAYHLKKAYPQLKYVIIDLPYTLYFSVPYIYNLFPESKICIYSRSEDLNCLLDYDFCFLPPWVLSNIPDKLFDITINQASLGEMTKDQVNYYCKNIARVTRGPLISQNRRLSNPLNNELNDFYSLLSKEFVIKELEPPLQRKPIYNIESNIRKVLTSDNSFAKGIRIMIERILDRKIMKSNEYEWLMCNPKH